MPGARRWRRRARSAWKEGLQRGSPGRQGQLTHLQPLPPAAEAAAAAAAAALAPRPPEPQAGRCWLPPQPLAPSRDPVAAAAGSRLRGRRRARSLSPPHAPTSTPSRGPGTAAWLHPGLRRGGGAPRRRAWGEKGAEATPERGEQKCWHPLDSAAWALPHPPPGPPPLRSLPRAGRWGGGGVRAVDTVDS